MEAAAAAGRASIRPGLQWGTKAGRQLAKQPPGAHIFPGNNNLRRLLALASSWLSAEPLKRNISARFETIAVDTAAVAAALTEVAVAECGEGHYVTVRPPHEEE